MRPADIQVIGEELAIRWSDQTESFIPLATMRQYCPCAGCQGEVDVMGKLHKGPAAQLTPASYQLKALKPVGGYALNPVWGDGHSSGLYSFEYLRKLAEIHRNQS